MKCFQHLLGKFPGVNWHPLRAFMDIFQGCYKNGTDGTVDCRYFAGFNLLLRIIMLFPVNDIVLLVFTVIMALARPYHRRNIFNFCEIFIYSSFLLSTLWMLVSFLLNYSLFLVYLLIHAFFAYFWVLCIAKVMKTFFPSCYSAFVERIKRFTEKTSFPCCCYQHEANRADVMERGEVDLFISHEMDADRVNNPQDYESLLVPCRQGACWEWTLCCSNLWQYLQTSYYTISSLC